MAARQNCIRFQTGMGMVAKISDFGATLVSLEVPDKDGKSADVTHGYDSVAGYAGAKKPVFRGIGRSLRQPDRATGSSASTARNIPSRQTIPREIFRATCMAGTRASTSACGKSSSMPRQTASRLNTFLPMARKDTQAPSPRNVTYTLTRENELVWEASATTTAPTVINLVHHTYWNLSGDPASMINDHELTLYAGPIPSHRCGVDSNG